MVGVGGYRSVWRARDRWTSEWSSRPLARVRQTALGRSAQTAVLLEVIPEQVHGGLAGVVRAPQVPPRDLGPFGAQ